MVLVAKEKKLPVFQQCLKKWEEISVLLGTKTHVKAEKALLWSKRYPMVGHEAKGGKQGEFKAAAGEGRRGGGKGVGLCWKGCGGIGWGRQSDARGLKEFGNLWVRKGKTNCDRVKDSICPLQIALRQHSWEGKGAAKGRAAICTPMSHVPCCKESAKGMQTTKWGWESEPRNKDYQVIPKNLFPNAKPFCFSQVIG